MAMNCNLPEDVVIQILLWLPVISLLRFKTVCKSWCALIESSSFIAQHIKKKHDYSHVILENHYLSKAKEKFIMLSGDKFEVCINLDTLPKTYWSFKEDNSEATQKLELVTSCNGILCIYHRETGDVALWNPAMKQLRALPNPIPNDAQTKLACLGLGFDAKTNDYKVIRILSVVGDDTRLKVKQAEVYSLSTDSWRIVNAILPVETIFSNPKAPYRDGIYTWTGRKIIEKDSVTGGDPLATVGHAIVSFDFSNEVFGTMPFPDVSNWPFLAFIGEFIACFACVSDLDDEYHYFGIWVLKEYGVKESWTKLYTLGPFYLNLYPRGFSNNGEFFWFTLNEQVVICNPVTKEMKNLKVQGAWRAEVFLYKESLVSIKGGNGGVNGVTCEV